MVERMITGQHQLAGRDVKAVISDLMCTLFNPGLQEEAVRQWATQSGLEHQALTEALTRHELEAGLGQPALIEDWMERVLTRAGQAGDHDTRHWRAQAHRLAVLSAAQGRPYPQVRELLVQLKMWYRVGILSTVSHRGRLAAKGLALDEPWVHAAVFSSDVHVMKPDRRAYEIVADRLGVPFEQCLFVDDHMAYVKAAQQLGLIGVIVLHPEGQTAGLIARGELTRDDLTRQDLTAIDNIAELGTLLRLPHWQVASDDNPAAGGPSKYQML